MQAGDTGSAGHGDAMILGLGVFALGFVVLGAVGGTAVLYAGWRFFRTWQNGSDLT